MVSRYIYLYWPLTPKLQNQPAVTNVKLKLFRFSLPCLPKLAKIPMEYGGCLPAGQDAPVIMNHIGHGDVIKWKHFPRNWPFVRGIHRSPVNSPHKGQWRVALIFSLICVWINDWINNREACDLRRYRAHYDITVMEVTKISQICLLNHASLGTKLWPEQKQNITKQNMWFNALRFERDDRQFPKKRSVFISIQISFNLFFMGRINKAQASLRWRHMNIM